MAYTIKRKKPSSYSSGLRKPRRNYKKILLLTVLPLAGVGIAGALVNAVMSEERMDAAYCFDRDNQLQHNFALDLSFTHGLSDNQSRDYQRIFDSAYERAAPNTKFSFHTTASDTEGSIASPVSEICKPPATVAEIKLIGAPEKPPALVENKAAEAEEAFDQITVSILSDAANKDIAAGDSAILEQIQAVSRYGGFQGRNREITILTDGLQNSQTARFCQVQGDLPPYDVFKTQRRYSYVAPDDLSDVTFNIMLVEHGRLPAPGMEYCTNHEVRQFWQDFARGNGAADVNLTILRHGAG